MVQGRQDSRFLIQGRQDLDGWLWNVVGVSRTSLSSVTMDNWLGGRCRRNDHKNEGWNGRILGKRCSGGRNRDTTFRSWHWEDELWQTPKLRFRDSYLEFEILCHIPGSSIPRTKREVRVEEWGRQRSWNPRLSDLMKRGLLLPTLTNGRCQEDRTVRVIHPTRQEGGEWIKIYIEKFESKELRSMIQK